MTGVQTCALPIYAANAGRDIDRHGCGLLCMEPSRQPPCGRRVPFPNCRSGVIGPAIAGNPENDGHLSPWQDRLSSDDLRDLGTMGLSLYRMRAILANRNVYFYHNTYLVRKGASMPTQSLPAPSLRTAICLPAGMPTWAGNPLIYRTLCAISVAGSIFLPALREASGRGSG